MKTRITACSLRHVRAILAPILLQCTSSASAQTTQDVPIRSCPDLMDFYPQAALRQEIQGQVAYLVKIDPLRIAQDMTISQSSGSDLLDQAGMKFLRRCRFMPTNNPHAKLRETTQKIIFRIPE